MEEDFFSELVRNIIGASDPEAEARAALRGFIRVRGDIHVDVVGSDGSVRSRDTPNVIVNIGKETLCSMSGLTGSDIEAHGWTALGTDSSVGPTQETLPGEIDRVVNAFQKQGTGIYRASSSHTGLTANASSAALFNAASAGLMLAGGTFTPIPIESTDLINILYTISFL